MPVTAPTPVRAVGIDAFVVHESLAMSYISTTDSWQGQPSLLPPIANIFPSEVAASPRLHRPVGIDALVVQVSVAVSYSSTAVLPC
jgi:hypothetical protein